MNLKKYLRWAILIPLLLLLTACPGEIIDPPFVEREPIIPETTKVPDEATRNALTVYNADTGEMRFNASTPILDNLKTGDVFVGEPSAAAPYGYLRKVTTIRKDGGEVVLETTQAKLTDAIHQGTLNVEGEVQPSQLRSVTPLMEGAYGGVVEGATDNSQSITGELQPQLQVGKGFFFEAGIDGKYETKEKAENGSGSFTATFKGLVKFNVGYRVIIDIGFLADLNYFEASMGFEEQVIIKLFAEGKGNFKEEWRVATFNFDPIKFSIGPVPVIIVPSATVTLGVDGNIQITFNYEFSQTAAFAQGVKWDDDNGFGKIDRNEFNVKHEGPSLSGTANFRAYARGNLRALLYNVGGADVGATVGAKLDVAFPRDPLWILSGFVKGDLSLVAEIELLGINERYSTELFNIEREIARGEAKPPTITILNPNATVGLRIASDLNQFFKVEDLIGATATLSSDRDGTVGSNIKFTTPGKRIITVTATSVTGKTAQASFNLDVINTPPSLSGVSGPTTIGAGVGWALTSSATASDPNEDSNRLTCSRLSWSITGGASLTTETGSDKGCSPFVVFGTEGEQHQITIVATDSDGASSTQTLTVNVTKRPENIPPTIKRLLVSSSNGDIEPGVTVLRSEILTVSADIYNPDNAPLEYEWSVFGPYNPVGFGYLLGSAATATYNGSDRRYDPGNNSPYECSLDNDNNPSTCPARFSLLLKSNGVTIGRTDFPFILNYPPTIPN